MDRLNAVMEIDSCAEALEAVAVALNQLGATHSMVSRVETLVRQLDDLRVDVVQADLLAEE